MTMRWGIKACFIFQALFCRTMRSGSSLSAQNQIKIRTLPAVRIA